MTVGPVPAPLFVVDDDPTGAQGQADVPLLGDEAEISDGPFEGERGVITRVLPGKQRVQILLDLMGRSVTAEFRLEAVLVKLSDSAATTNASMDLNGGRRLVTPRATRVRFI